MKITLIGISGTGKTTTARKLQKITNIESLFADSFIWGENWTLRNDDIVAKEMLNVLKDKQEWIYEGYLTYIADYVLKNADIVIYLDYPGVVAFSGVVKRWWKYRKTPRPEFAKGCEERLLWNYFFNTVLFRRERTKIEMLLNKYPPLNLYRFKSRRELNLFLKNEFNNLVK